MKHKQLVRQAFREAVFKRDGYACVFCKSKDNLDAHHITDRNEMPNGGYVKENGITVCPRCHLQCEQFHINKGGDWVEGKHPADLYELIGSSYEEALRCSF